MINLKTRTDLLASLERAAQKKLSPEQLRKQRVSFIMGSLKGTNSVTRERIAEFLQEMEGEKTPKRDNI